MRALYEIARLAAKDYLHERMLSLCALLALAAVMAPLLVLFGVKYGIVTTMLDRLVEDPRNREIWPVGSHAFDRAAIAALAARPDVAFVVPETRMITASLGLKVARDILDVDMVPSGDGDPLLLKFARVPEADTQVVLSASAARKLGVAAGQSLTGVIGRSRDGTPEQADVALTVAAVLPVEAERKDTAFVRLRLLEAAEEYRDGFGVADFGWAGPPRPEGDRRYPGFRLYARSIDDVAALAALFAAQDIDVVTKAAEISTVRTLDHAFSLVFWIIAGVAGAGSFAATAATAIASVLRKRRDLGVMSLLGFQAASLVCFPLVQALLTAVLGTLLALSVFLPVAIAVNHVFAPWVAAGEQVCRLKAAHAGFALAAAIAVMTAAALFAARKVGRIQPSEVVRDV